MVNVQYFDSPQSNIRHEDFCRLVRLFVLCNAQGTPHWIMKRDGLESSGQRLISSSYIKKEKYNPATTTPMHVCMSRSGYPPWILKRGGLESSGRRLISSIGNTKGISFLFLFYRPKKNKRK